MIKKLALCAVVSCWSDFLGLQVILLKIKYYFAKRTYATIEKIFFHYLCCFANFLSLLFA